MSVLSTPQTLRRKLSKRPKAQRFTFLSQLTLNESMQRMEAVKSEKALPVLPAFREHFDFEYSPSANSIFEGRDVPGSAREQPQNY